MQPTGTRDDLIVGVKTARRRGDEFSARLDVLARQLTDAMASGPTSRAEKPASWNTIVLAVKGLRSLTDNLRLQNVRLVNEELERYRGIVEKLARLKPRYNSPLPWATGAFESVIVDANSLAVASNCTVDDCTFIVSLANLTTEAREALKDYAQDAAGTSQPQGAGEGHGDGTAVDTGSARARSVEASPDQDGSVGSREETPAAPGAPCKNCGGVGRVWDNGDMIDCGECWSATRQRQRVDCLPPIASAAQTNGENCGGSMRCNGVQLATLATRAEIGLMPQAMMLSLEKAGQIQSLVAAKLVATPSDAKAGAAAVEPKVAGATCSVCRGTGAVWDGASSLPCMDCLSAAREAKRPAFKPGDRVRVLGVGARIGKGATVVRVADKFAEVRVDGEYPLDLDAWGRYPAFRWVNLRPETPFDLMCDESTASEGAEEA
jgi:hypothetical protein